MSNSFKGHLYYNIIYVKIFLKIPFNIHVHKEFHEVIENN